MTQLAHPYNKGGKKDDKAKAGGGSEEAPGGKGLAAAAGLTASEFKRLMNLQYLSALGAPG